MTGSTVRISDTKREMLRELAAWTGESMQAVLEEAIERYRRALFLERANAAYTALREDASAWREELAERAEWDITLGDDLNTLEDE